MRLPHIPCILLVAAVVAGPLLAQQEPPAKKRILAIGESNGYQHDAMSYGLASIWRYGRDSGLWDTYIRTDTQLITKKQLPNNAKNLDYFDAVVFYTTGEPDLDDQQKADLLSFVRDDGKGFIGIHSAADTFYQWPEYGELLGGYFDQHPWGTFDAPIIVEDRENSITGHFPTSLVIHDEIYQFKNFSRDRVRVLMRLDETKLDLKRNNVHRTDGDFAVTWVHNYGKGRVFYTTLGHVEETFERPDVEKMFTEAARWVLRDRSRVDATPRPRPAP